MRVGQCEQEGEEEQGKDVRKEPVGRTERGRREGQGDKKGGFVCPWEGREGRKEGEREGEQG